MNQQGLSKNIIIIVVLLGLIFVALIFVVLTNNRDEQQLPTTSPTPLPINLNYPIASQQPFVQSGSNQKGVLIVETTPAQAEIKVDEQEITGQDSFAPTNLTPVMFNDIPVGKHIVRVRKAGYLTTEIEATVEPNKVNKLEIYLTANEEADTINKIKTLLPITTDEYTIENLSNINKIQVIIRQEPFRVNKQKAIDWFKQNGVQNPEKESSILFYPALGVKEQ
jgi:hypothetical protein